MCTGPTASLGYMLDAGPGLGYKGGAEQLEVCEDAMCLAERNEEVLRAGVLAFRDTGL